MRCIFVLDIFNGAVVHAVRGERSRYEQIERYSKIVSTSRPLKIVQAIRPKEIYAADLNLLTGSGDNLIAIEAVSLFAKTFADTGASRLKDLDRLAASIAPVLGTETGTLRLFEKASRRRRIVASLDMIERTVMSRDKEIAASDPIDVLKEFNDLNLEAVILLELDRVGTSKGIDIDFLETAASISRHPLILGGGIKDEEDLDKLGEAGFEGALVATAVHNGKIPIERLR